MTNPLEDALARLREEVTKAEERLATLTDEPLGDRLSAAAEVHAARLRAEQAETVLPGAAHARRAQATAEALGPLFASREEPDGHTPDDETGLAGLLA